MTPTEAITTLALTADIMQAAAKQDAPAAGAKYAAMRDYLTAVVERDAPVKELTPDTSGITSGDNPVVTSPGTSGTTSNGSREPFGERDNA